MKTTKTDRLEDNYAVYLIVHGFAAEPDLYAGTQEQCRVYVGRHPELKGNVIIANI